MNEIRKKVYRNKYMYKLAPLIANLMIKLHLMKKMIIVRCDGGVCSQINFYLVGKYFMDMGYEVKFDNDWFHLHGKDMNGVFDRKFDLLKIFPNIPYALSSPKENFYYRKCFRYINDNSKEGQEEKGWKEKCPPVYMDGYYRLKPERVRQYISSCFHIDYDVLDKINKEILREIRKNNSVAVHVRRGDLAGFVPSYGEPLSNNYFLHAIQKLKQDVGNKKNGLFYYFFSDEPDWVEKTLLPILQNEIEKNYLIMDINGSEKGYMDLLLMTGCKYIIASKGSLGKYAALLARDSVEKVVLVDGDRTKWWTEVLDNVVIINENKNIFKGD